jgi:hypothetical protein
MRDARQVVSVPVLADEDVLFAELRAHEDEAVRVARQAVLDGRFCTCPVLWFAVLTRCVLISRSSAGGPAAV